MFITSSSIFTIVFGLIALIWLFTSIFIVRQQTVRVVETFGRYNRVATSGLNFKWPWPIQSASDPMSLRILEIGEDVTVKSNDNAFLTIPIRVQYQVRDNRAQDAFYKLDNPEEQIRSYIVNQVRSTASGLSFNELFQARNTFESDVEETLSEQMDGFGFHIINVLVDDPQPSNELREAFDRVIASKRLREAASNEGEAARIMQVAKANAEGEALEIKGRAYANFRKIVAEGNAEALEAFCKETGLQAQDGLSFFTSINEMEAIRDAAQDGGKIVFVASSNAGRPDAALLGMVAGQSDGVVSSHTTPRNTRNNHRPQDTSTDN